MTQILDYSAGYPGALHIQRLGYGGGIRYLRKEGTSSVRPLTPAEVLDYESRGLQLALVYQHVRKSRVLEGRAAGRHDAAWALAQARECGVEPRAIYFAVDFDTISAEQWAAVREYMLGATEVLGLGRVGTYGEYDLLDYLFARGSITWGWQTYAWSVGHNKDNQPRHPRAHLFQRLGLVTVNGISCDVNDVLQSDWGQHNQEDDMPLTAADVEKIWGAKNGIYEALRNVLVDAAAQNPTGGYAEQIRGALRACLAGLPVAIDAATAAEIAEQLGGPVADRLVEHGVIGITPEQVKAALTEVLDQTSLTVGGGTP